MKTHIDIAEAKTQILAGATWAQASRSVGCDSLTLLNLLGKDPDIVAARERGELRKPKRTASPDHYSRLPHVRAVLDEGMSQTEAAKKFGKFQAQISRDVGKARAEREKAKPAVAAGAADPDSVIDALAGLVKGHADLAGVPPAELLKRVQAALN